MKSNSQEKQLKIGADRHRQFRLGLILVLIGVVFAGTYRTSEAAPPLSDQAAAFADVATEPSAVNQTNYALQFDGTDDFARVIDIGNFDFGTAFTIEAWVKPDSVMGPSLLKGLVSGRASDQPNSTGGWVMYLPSTDHSQWGMSVCTPGCSAAVAPPASLVAGEWHHLAAIYDGTQIQIYHNGVLTDTVSQSGDVTDVNYLFLGAWTGTFAGTLDEVRIWNIARTPAELRSTMFSPLQGSETGLVAYWNMNEGTGQFALDGTGSGQSARLGSTDTVDTQDPTWVASDSPIFEPFFQLTPNLGGLGTDIGISSVLVPGLNCGWIHGETVEVWWDKPEAQLAVFTTGADGCFEGMFNLDDGERIPGSEAGTHAVQARGSLSGVIEVPFEQTVSQLHLNPAQGPSDIEVTISGCGWDGASMVNVLWQRDNSLLARATVDGATGCINDVLRIPRTKDGFYGLVAYADVGLLSAAAYWVKSATIFLTPNEGPPGANIPLAGCGWLPEEQIDFAFSSDGVAFDTLGTSIGGCITTGGPTEPTLWIPVTTTLGAKTIQATGLDSGQVINVPFTVVTRTLVFDPDSGLPGDPIAASGCGWVGNSQVTVEWGYPDTNGLPIRWVDSVDASSGCFGTPGDFIINVPDNTIGGPVVETATGDIIGSATATFTVTHSGHIEFPNTNGYAGYPLTVNIFDAVIGETITFRWDVGYAFDGIGAATSDFSYDITMPKYASVGLHTVTADGTKGFNDQATVNILDNAQISVTTGGDIYPGSTIRLDGTNWSAGELVRFKLQSGASSWPVAGSITVPADAIDFSDLISLPSNVPAGAYVLMAEGNKGRDANTGLTITAAPAPSFTLSAAYADAPPNLDGNLRGGEWDYDKRVAFNQGFISARSDETRLYLLLDLLGDTEHDSAGLDNFWLSFDVWNNRQIDAGFDLNFRLDGSGDFVLEEYTGPDSFAPRNSANLRSAYGDGFGCFVNDGTLSFALVGFIPKITCTQHRVWEIAVDLATIVATPGGTVHLGIRAISQSPSFSDDVPPGFPSDFSELGAITLASSKLPPNSPAGNVLGIGSGDFEVEITQAIQDAANSLSLVADKDTVVRVYPQMEAEALVRVFLFGQRNNVDLPGSPLVTLATVPVTIDRKALSQTANFLLPDSWITAGLTQLTVVVENLNGQNTNAVQESVIFYERDVPVIWVFPFNEGTAAAPLLPTMADMVEQEQVLERLLPVPDVAFVHRSWTEIGTTNPISFTTMKKELSRYWRTMAMAAATSNNLASLPDMLFGFKVGRDPKAVGTSDPIYSGGRGIVVVGQADGSDFNSTTMVHEVNHNLDRSARGTWGRHVANPEDVESKSWGCGADGPDLAWPYTGNDNIQEIGFDTTLPWTDGAGQHLTVVPATRDDFMSYCWKRGTPIQWISPYRWQAMFNRFVPISPASTLLASTAITQVYYISGSLNLSGTGSLDPVITQPGIISTPVVTGAYTLEVENASQETLFSTSFTAVFTDAEGVPFDDVTFDYQLPVQVGATRILLKHNDQVLDEIYASAHPPMLQVTAPGDGDVWSGGGTISWTADDVDGDPLEFTILYTPDEGANWFPVATTVTDTTYYVDEGLLPGSTSGKVKVIAIDGFHTVEAQSTGTFFVPYPAPTVAIHTPAEGGTYFANEWITLSGTASGAGWSQTDVYTYTWSVDGQITDVGPEVYLLLNPGQHMITLAAYDGLGNYGETSVSITVLAGSGKVYLPVIMR
jgi:hypothetical protein